MTIKQYAQNAGVSPQAVYQRLKKNKIKVESLTEKGTGEITGEGITILDKLFDPENRQTKPAKDELIEALEQQISELRADLARKDERIESLQKVYDDTKETSAYWQQAFIKEQEIHSLLLKALPAPATESEKPAQASQAGSRKLTWRERFSGKISSSKG